MARSIDEIYGTLSTGVTSNLPLTDNGITTYTQLIAALNNGSYVGVWQRFLLMVCYACHFTEVLFDRHKAEVLDIVKAGIAGTVEWFRFKAFEFQLYYYLQVDDVTGVLSYATVDDTAKIVKYCAVEESAYGVILKVANDDSGSPVALGGSQLQYFKAYINRIKPAGVSVQVISLGADAVTISLPFVEFDYFKYVASNGVPSGELADILRDQVALKIAALPFNGVLKTADVIDIFKGFEWVVKFKIDRISIVRADEPRRQYFLYDLATGVDNIEYRSLSGYFILNDIV